MPLIYPYKGAKPKIAPEAWIAPNAVVAGDVEIGPRSAVWFGCTVRGDVNVVRIGAGTNLQDNSVIHVAREAFGTFIGDDVLIGHMCLIHACTIEERATVGMQSCVMDGAVVEAAAMVAAGSLVTPGKVVKSRQLWGGRPAKFMRALSDDEIGEMLVATKLYAEYAETYRSQIEGQSE